MSMPPTIHQLCDDCWKKTPRGAEGVLPARVTAIKPATCCGCGTSNMSGIYYPEQPRAFACRGAHPMTEGEYDQTMLDFFIKAAEVAITRLCNAHKLDVAPARQHILDAIIRTALLMHAIHGTVPTDVPALERLLADALEKRAAGYQVPMDVPPGEALLPQDYPDPEPPKAA